MHQYGGKHPKQKDTVNTRVVSKHAMFEKKQRGVELDHSEWGESSWRDRWRQLVYGLIGQVRELDITVKARKSPWRVLSREWMI